MGAVCISPQVKLPHTFLEGLVQAKKTSKWTYHRHCRDHAFLSNFSLWQRLYQVVSPLGATLARLRYGSLSLGLLVRTVLVKDYRTGAASPPLKTQTYPTWCQLIRVVGNKQ